MGCVSSKIMTKSASFHEEFNRSIRRRTNGVDEIIITKNSEDQFVALLCTANTVARRLKEQSPAQEPHESKNSLMSKNSSESKNICSNSNGTNEPDRNDIETINTWELLAGLEDGNEGEEHHIGESPKNENQIGPSRSFRTVEDFDAMVAANQPLECSERSIKELELKHASGDKNASSEEGNDRNEKGSRRKAMAKDLTALKVPSSFEFTRAGSLRDWLLQGGQVFSPGSYTTPKFGNFVSPGTNNGDTTNGLDPELVQQFEQAMEQMTLEEESILKEIMEVGSI